MGWGMDKPSMLSCQRHLANRPNQPPHLPQVYYNNLLSVPPLAVLSLAMGEPWLLRGYHHMGSLEFQVGERSEEACACTGPSGL